MDDFTRTLLQQPGPWTAEMETYPDGQYDFIHNGYECRLRRGFGGQWNGYVVLPKDHPDRGKDYTALEEFYTVHGGLTYSDSTMLGFDTSHYMDIIPASEFLGVPVQPGGKYWTIEDMVVETTSLADQVHARYLLVHLSPPGSQ